MRRPEHGSHRSRLGNTAPTMHPEVRRVGPGNCPICGMGLESLMVTVRNIRKNLFFAFIYNAAGVPIAAGMLYPVFGILLSPVIAAAAMALSSVSVIANAVRLKLVRL